MQSEETILEVFREMSGSILPCTGVAEAAKVDENCRRKASSY